MQICWNYKARRFGDISASSWPKFNRDTS